jgi:hypothetical protein
LLPACSKGKAPPPRSFRAEASKKVFFFLEEKTGARKSKNVKKTFLLDSER